MKSAFHRIFFLLMCSVGVHSLSAQTDTTKNEKDVRQHFVYGELCGSGYLFSVNYEHQLYQTDHFRLNARIGIGSAVLINALPIVGMNALLGKNATKFEIGVNINRTFAIGIMSDDGNYVMLNPVLGSRYQSKKGFIFRATISPFIPIYDPSDFIPPDRTFYPFAGISFGYAFR
ncbi:MAG: hypothetical protein RLZZ543_1721 [Bacteroidota bacterium]|jgi:hypothetical protein